MPLTAPSGTPPTSPAADWPRFDPRTSLRARAAVCFAGAAFALAAISAWAGGRLARADAERRLGATSETLAFQIGQTIQRSVYERYQALQFAARTTAVGRNATPAERRIPLELLLESSSELAWAGVAAADGTIVAATQRVREGSSAANVAWFRGAQGRVYVGPIREDATLARTLPTDEGVDPRVFEVAIPLGADTETPGGVLVASLRWALVQPIVAAAVPEPLRREGVAVTLYGGAGEVIYDSAVLGWSLPPEWPAAATGAQRRGYCLERTVAGTEFLTGFARSRGFLDFAGLPLLVVVRQPVTEAFRGAAELRTLLLSTGALLALVCGGIGWWVAAPLSRELRRIAATAARIRSGDTLAILPAPDGGGEVARACRALRGLIEQLRGRDPDA